MSDLFPQVEKLTDFTMSVKCSAVMPSALCRGSAAWSTLSILVSLAPPFSHVEPVLDFFLFSTETFLQVLRSEAFQESFKSHSFE